MTTSTCTIVLDGLCAKMLFAATALIFSSQALAQAPSSVPGTKYSASFRGDGTLAGPSNLVSNAATVLSSSNPSFANAGAYAITFAVTFPKAPSCTYTFAEKKGAEYTIRVANNRMKDDNDRNPGSSLTASGVTVSQNGPLAPTNFPFNITCE
jgi:hypothetical protein